MEAWQASSKELRDDFSARSQGLIDDRNSQLDQLEKRYLAINEYEKPADYWRQKAEGHKDKASRWGLAALAVAIIGGSGLIYLHHGALAAVDEKTSMAQLTGKLFPVVLGTLGLLWLIRIMVRTYLSHVHLQTDADERVVLAQTYLAMLEGKRPLNEPEMVIVLTQLFRHSPTGINKDDYSPVVPSDVLMKLAGK